MHPAEATVIMHTLLSCRTLFSDFFPIPNYVTLTSFEYTPSDGITVQEWTNGTQEPKKKIKFTGTNVLRIQLQMAEKDGKMVLGGQVTVTAREMNCPVFGDINELRFLFPGEECFARCFYRLKDLIYQIDVKAGEVCRVYDLERNEVRWFFSPSQFDCKSPFGLVPDEELVVFKKNGECKQADFSVLDKSYTPQPCSRREIELGPNKLSQYYHLRYLLSISGCGENITDIGDPDNIYVRFMHKNETLIEPTEPPSTTVVVVPEESHLQEYLAYGIFSAVGFVLVVLIILVVIFRKKLWDKFRRKKEPSGTGQPAPGQSNRGRRPIAQLASAVPPTPEELPLATTQDLEETKELEPGPEDLAKDEMGNIDENLKSVNPMDMLLELQLKPGETFEDEEAKWTLPTIVNCIQPYKYVKFLGAGGFGRVYKYAVLSQYEAYVAIKFVRTDGNKEDLISAKVEFMLIRQIQRMFKAADEYYLLRVVDVGKYPNFVFIVSPFYYRCMDFFMPDCPGFAKATIADILTVAWNYLKGIQQLHSVGYGHNDIKPENYMQKDQGLNTIVLCDFGLVKKFGSKRNAGIGTAHYMSLGAHKGIDTSNVDDYQSWLFLLTMMLTRSQPWLQDMKLDSEDPEKAEEDLFQQKFYFFKKVSTQVNEKPKPELKLVDLLRYAIITGHGPKNPVDPKKVVSIMEEAQSTFNFKYETHEWCRFDQNLDSKNDKTV